VRTLSTLLCAAAVVGLTGCLGGTPMPDRAKFAARSWADTRLRPGKLQVTSVSVARDQRRARVELTADGDAYKLRLERPGDEWHVVAARRG
jgi:hypothetical protein